MPDSSRPRRGPPRPAASSDGLAVAAGPAPDSMGILCMINTRPEPENRFGPWFRHAAGVSRENRYDARAVRREAATLRGVSGTVFTAVTGVFSAATGAGFTRGVVARCAAG